MTSCDPQQRWQAYALDLGSGDVLPGWPVRWTKRASTRSTAMPARRRSPPTRRFDFRVQRGALNLSPDGRASTSCSAKPKPAGWCPWIRCTRRSHSAFAAVAMPHRGSGGIWGAGGPAVDASGNVFVVTGSGYDGFVEQRPATGPNRCSSSPIAGDHRLEPARHLHAVQLLRKARRWTSTWVPAARCCCPISIAGDTDHAAA